MNLFALVNGAPWIFGPVTFAGTITFTGSALLADGSAAAPALAFAADTDTGIYRPGANEIAFVTGGTERASFISQGLKLSNVGGSFTVPNVFANGDSDTGLATIGGNQLALVVGGATALSFNNSTNATIGGNLTVSGGTTTLADSNGSFGTITGSYNAGNAFVRFNRIGATESVGFYADNSTRFINNNAETARFFANGNLFVGASPVDGGQKLQVAGTAMIATSVASANIFFVKNTASNGYSTIQFEDNGGTARGYIGYGNSGTPLFTSQFYIGSPGSIALASGGNTTALTLDSSQRATFSQNVILASGKLLSLNNNATLGSYALQAATASSPYDFRFIGDSDAVTQRNFSFGYYTTNDVTLAWNEKAKINSYTGNATFAGSIAIGNTVQTAASVASTHKVTISIGGSTYYLLATNV